MELVGTLWLRELLRVLERGDGKVEVLEEAEIRN